MPETPPRDGAGAPCGRFELAVDAAGYNVCRHCGSRKADHERRPSLRSPELSMKLSRRESMNEALDPYDADTRERIARGEARTLREPCARFRRDLSGQTFDSCVCGRSKSDHASAAPSPPQPPSAWSRTPPAGGTPGRGPSAAVPPVVDLAGPEDTLLTDGVEDDSDGETEIYFCGRPAMLPHCGTACSLWAT